MTTTTPLLESKRSHIRPEIRDVHTRRIALYIAQRNWEEDRGPLDMVQYATAALRKAREAAREAGISADRVRRAVRRAERWAPGAYAREAARFQHALSTVPVGIIPRRVERIVTTAVTLHALIRRLKAAGATWSKIKEDEHVKDWRRRLADACEAARRAGVTQSVISEHIERGKALTAQWAEESA